MVVVTGDNGMPFPRSKANLYGIGTRMPLAIRWPGKVKVGRKVDEVVSHTDFAPTFLEAAGIKPPPEMTGRSMMDILKGPATRDFIVTERERHVDCRTGDRSYPARAIRTKGFVYIRNFEPDLWPAGDPKMWVGVGDFGDIDTGPSKTLILSRRDDPKIKPFFDLATAKRPAEELYDPSKDPWELHNVADDPHYAQTKKKLRDKLDAWMKKTADPRATNPHDDRWDKYYYAGTRVPWVYPKPKK
jgi:arylsulfatase A-like enzyme